MFNLKLIHFLKWSHLCFLSQLAYNSEILSKFAISIVGFSCLFCNTKISEFFDMTKSWAARLCSLACSSNRLCRLPKQELLVAQVLKKFNL